MCTLQILLSQKREQVVTNRPAPPLVPDNPDINPMPSESLHSPILSTPHKSPPSPPEPVAYPIPTTPITPSPPAYTDIQKHPDSSNIEATIIATEESPSKSDPSSPCKKESRSCASPVPTEESIQVAEISSSNVTDEPSTSADDANSSALVESASSDVASSLFEGSSSEEADTKFILEKKSWLQEVPVAEQYSGDSDLQSIRFSEPTGPRLRRGIHDTSATPKRMTGTVMRQTNGRRRHSTGAPQNSQRQQRQRRSLTPKTSTSSASPFLAPGNKLKRRAKEMSDYEETRNGVGTRHSAEAENGESCLKRRTRSEDVRNMQDENDPANQTVDNRLRWPVTDTPISRTSTYKNFFYFFFFLM